MPEGTVERRIVASDRGRTPLTTSLCAAVLLTIAQRDDRRHAVERILIVSASLQAMASVSTSSGPSAVPRESNEPKKTGGDGANR